MAVNALPRRHVPPAGDAARPAAPPPRPPRRRADGYSRFVAVMRWFLPACAVGLTLLVVLWPQVFGRNAGPIRPILDRAARVAGDAMQMSNPRYQGRTENNEPYRVEAATARLDPADTNLVHLNRPKGTLEGERTVRLDAARGVYARDKRTVELDGGVVVRSADGYRARTEAAHVDIDAGRVRGDTAVAVDGPDGTLRADRFTLEDQGAVMHFEGRVRVVVTPGGAVAGGRTEDRMTGAPRPAGGNGRS